jgi:hypothetical protein
VRAATVDLAGGAVGVGGGVRSASASGDAGCGIGSEPRARVMRLGGTGGGLERRGGDAGALGGTGGGPERRGGDTGARGASGAAGAGMSRGADVRTGSLGRRRRRVTAGDAARSVSIDPTATPTATSV